MVLQIASAVVSGSTSENHYGYGFAQDKCFIVVEIEKKENTAHAPKTLVTALYKHLEKHPPKTATSLKKSISDVIKNAQVQMLVGYVLNHTLLITSTGKGRMVVLRGKKIGVVIEGRGTVSGTLYCGDRLVFSNNAFSKVILLDRLVEFLQGKSIDKSQEEIAKALHKSSGDAVAIVAFVCQKEKTNHEMIAKHGKDAGSDVTFFSFKQKTTAFLNYCKNFVLDIQARIVGENRCKKGLFTANIMLVAVLAASVLFGLRMRNSQKQAVSFTASYENALHKFEEGMALLDLNPIRSRELLNQAHDVLEELSADRISNQQKEQVLGLSTKIQDGIVVAEKSFDSILSPFLDITLIKPEAEAAKMSLYQGVLALLDVKNSALYSVALESKASEIVFGGEEFEGALYVATHGDNFYVLTGSNIVRVRKGEKKTKKIVKESKYWEKIVSMVAYAGNLYLLDQEAGQIWKYIAGDSGFSDTRKYLAPDTFPDFSKSTSLTIDESVWVGGNGEVLKFTHGAPQSFVVSGLSEALGDNISLFTTENEKNLYILDRDNRRVVAVDKKGVYQAQYRWEDEVAISDFVVSENLRKIFLLSGNMIYEIELK